MPGIARRHLRPRFLLVRYSCHCDRLSLLPFRDRRERMPRQRKYIPAAKAKIAMTLISAIAHYCSSSKNSLPTPHAGHVQSSGSSSNEIPGGIPFSGSPSEGSYMYPQTLQIYRFITTMFNNPLYGNIRTLSASL